MKIFTEIGCEWNLNRIRTCLFLITLNRKKLCNEACVASLMSWY